VTAAKKRPAAAPAVGQQLAAGVAVCVIEGCEEPVLHRGLCEAHWEDPRQK
jgi:hypothetical protein